VTSYNRPSHGFAERSAKDHVAQEVSIVDAETVRWGIVVPDFEGESR
jgi:hypothetical protein